MLRVKEVNYFLIVFSASTERKLYLEDYCFVSVFFHERERDNCAFCYFAIVVLARNTLSELLEFWESECSGPGANWMLIISTFASICIQRTIFNESQNLASMIERF